MRRKSGTLTAQELEIMKAIWSRAQVTAPRDAGPASRGVTVREIYDALRERRTVGSTPPGKVRAAGAPAYTTVQTMMNILESKGHLKKEPGDKAQVYVPVRPQQAVVKSMVREFVERVFDGSARPLLVHLLNEKGLTERERKELQRLLEKGGAPPGAVGSKGDV